MVSLYKNPIIKTTEIENLMNKFCCVILNNGFSYLGIISRIYDDTIVFMDRKTGQCKFPRNRIFVAYELPKRPEMREEKNERI